MESLDRPCSGVLKKPAADLRVVVNAQLAGFWKRVGHFVLGAGLLFLGFRVFPAAGHSPSHCGRQLRQGSLVQRNRVG